MKGQHETVQNCRLGGMRNPPRRAANRLPRLRWHATTMAMKDETAKSQRNGYRPSLWGEQAARLRRNFDQGNRAAFTLRDVHIRAWNGDYDWT